MKTKLLAPVVAFVAVCLTSAPVRAEAQSPGPQRAFASPEEARDALIQAAKAHDHQAIHEIFGPDVTNMMTGDKTLDERHFDSFAKAVSERCDPVKGDNASVTLEIGADHWPFPIPLVQTNGSWVFDTVAGEEEVINRHIGRDEFYAIGVCRAYVKAQKDYSARMETNGGPIYARRFKSEPGKMDGLYWASENGGPSSPFSSVVAEACLEGYGWSSSKRPLPFHGYFFKILTRQGSDAPGGRKNYLRHGELTEGFALVAYPVRWGQSGIMTFIVNQDGTVYQRSLGEETAKWAGKMKDYNPSKDWSVVQEEGISDLTADEPDAVRR